jgi:RNA ligase
MPTGVVMVTLAQIGLDPAELNNHILDGLIRVQSHPSLPLFIYNYTEKAQFEKRWNDYTLNCRGLILDDAGKVVARPWKKFFNLGEGFAEFDWDSPVEVTDKMDGSLGILYDHGTGLAIATRGSFDSDQARHANRVLREKYSDVYFPESLTYLFEIVYPANRVVLNYGEMDDLVLLGAVNIAHGYYVGPREAAGMAYWPGPVTKVFEYRTLQEAFSADPRPNAEGYVVRSGNKMVKLKQVDYVELHRIVTNLNERTVWELCGQGKTIAEICEPLPDELHDWVNGVATDLASQAAQIIDKIVDEYLDIVDSLPYGYTRRQYADVASKSPNRAYLFKLFDNQKISGMVWQTLKPSVSKE